MANRRINITAGDCLAEILQRKYPDEVFVPFREAMIEGPNTHEPFSEAFLRERAAFHNVDLEQYQGHMAPFLNVLDRLDGYEEIDLWFGEEPFCVKNTEVVVETLRLRNYRGRLDLHIVNEETGETIRETDLP